LRLARFNTQSGSADKRYFQGLASPAAAALLAGLVWLGTDLGWEGADKRIITFLLTFFAGVLMVSNIRYYSFKAFHFKNRVSFVAMLAVVLVYAFASIDPPKVLFAGFLIYAVSGVVYTLVEIRKRRKARKRGE